MTYSKDRQLGAEELAVMWDEFFLERTARARNLLIQHYIWLVRYALSGMRLPSHSVLSDDDFTGFGIIGLHEALDRFDPERGLKFETFAFHRIKGVVLDEMRRLDWLSRTARRRAQEYLDAVEKVRRETGREASAEEIRERLGVSGDEYADYLTAAAAATASFDVADVRSSAAHGDDDAAGIGELPDPDWRNMLAELADEERLQFLTGYLDNLPERKRLVMALYYYEELTFKDIGNVLGVTESRVCQIHTTIIKDLRERFRTIGFAER